MSEVSLGRIGVLEFTPVVFTGTAGGGSGEYHGSNDPDVPEEHIIDVALPQGARIVEAWYTPFHGIPNLSAFTWLDVNSHGDRQVKLSVAGTPGANTRLRIKIHVLYVG